MNKKSPGINILIVILFLLIGNQTLYNQPKGYGVMLQGKIIDAGSGKPIGTSLMFINEKGKKWNSRSNDADGTYQQPLNFGSQYDVFIKGYLPINNHLKIDLTQNSQYEELTTDIFVKPLEPNVELFKYKFFEPNDSVVINKENFQFLKTFIDFNPKVKLKIVISSYDSWFNKSKIKVEKIDKKGRKSYKTVSYSTKEQLLDLLDARIISLRNEFKDNGIFIKFEAFVKDLQVVPQSKKQMKKAIPGKSKKYELYTPDFDNVKVVISK
ncbi:MAG: hypothetical protein V1779_14805 [bacterium]